MQQDDAFDISLVLVVQGEARFLSRTLTSFAEAVRYGRSYDLTFEIVVVADRPSPATSAWIEAQDFSAFDGRRVIAADNGSVALSRNDGARAAAGRHVALYDAGDLISCNLLAESCFTAASHDAGADGAEILVMPQHLFVLGEPCRLRRLPAGEALSALSFFARPPYGSSLFVHRRFFETFAYEDTLRRWGVACEHWLLQCEALSRGAVFATAPGTIVYSRAAIPPDDGGGVPPCSDLLPCSSLFRPQNFLKACAADQDRPAPRTAAAPPGRFLDSPLCLELTCAANAIDPAISLERAVEDDGREARAAARAAGSRYFELCRLAGDAPVTDVFLMDALEEDPDSGRLIDVANGLQALDPDVGLLMLCAERPPRRAALERLSDMAAFIDLYDARDPRDAVIDALTLRLIRAIGRGARIHFQASPYASRFLRANMRFLEGNRLIYHRAPDPLVWRNGTPFSEGRSFALLSDLIDGLDRIIAVNDGDAREDRARFAPWGDRFHTLYERRPLLTTAARLKARPTPSRRLLWAAPSGERGRPGLPPAIARRLQDTLPGIVIDVFEPGARGPSGAFAALGHHDYDALLYAGFSQSFPSLIGEAMAAGLPVIAPDVGAIRDAVSFETGALIEPSDDDGALADACVAAILRLYDHPATLPSLALRALALASKRGAPEAFLDQLARIFQTPRAGRDHDD